MESLLGSLSDLCLLMSSPEFKGSRVLVLGVERKCDIDNLRESSSLMIIELLQNAAQVEYNDPFFQQLSRAANIH